jgi:hypothetical protein
MTKSLESEKIAIIEQILKVKDSSKISQISEVVADLVIPNAMLPVLTTEDIMAHIEESRKDYREGNFLSHEEFKKIAKNW